jgi:HEAT repeat protein
MNRATGKEQLLKSLSENLLNPGTPEAERQRARQALERLSDEATLLQLIHSALASESAQVVQDVFGLVENRRSAAELEPDLVGFLYNSAPEVRQKALRLLGDKGSTRMIPYLDNVIMAALKESSIFGSEDLQMATQARQKIVNRGR